MPACASAISTSAQSAPGGQADGRLSLARTVRCKGFRATIPLLKTRWLAKQDNKRVLLTMTRNAGRTSVVVGIENNVPIVGGNAAQQGSMTSADVLAP